MRKPWLRALQGLALATGAPLGWLLIRWLGGADPWQDLLAQPGIYAYLEIGTAAAFGGFGWYVGRSEERLRRAALHDVLTGLYNRRYFRDRLGDECAFAARHGHPLALLIGDIDWFKRVNDTWGHAAGDRVLAAVAGVLVTLRRRGDTAARVGGEEFGVILPETGVDEAVQVAERLREAVAALRFDGSHRGTTWGITISFGVAVLDASASPRRLFEHADAALYQAKRAGRNRVVVHGAPMPVPPAAGAAAPSA